MLGEFWRQKQTSRCLNFTCRQCLHVVYARHMNCFALNLAVHVLNKGRKHTHGRLGKRPTLVHLTQGPVDVQIPPPLLFPSASAPLLLTARSLPRGACRSLSFAFPAHGKRPLPSLCWRHVSFGSFLDSLFLFLLLLLFIVSLRLSCSLFTAAAGKNKQKRRINKGGRHTNADRQNNKNKKGRGKMRSIERKQNKTKQRFTQKPQGNEKQQRRRIANSKIPSPPPKKRKLWANISAEEGVKV
ncbi:hypothetical protein TCSYLVIO_001744 [Trypanosoma cruzi]|nr:hypothetical protein TCSYLVIO_001744 [Trypanosoma cruzi]